MLLNKSLSNTAEVNALQDALERLFQQTVASEIGANGSYAAAQTHNDVRQEIADGDKRMVEHCLQQLVAWITQMAGAHLCRYLGERYGARPRGLACQPARQDHRP